MSCETHTRQAEKSHLVEISHLEPYHVAEIYLTLNPFLLLRYTSPWILILLFRYILLEPSLVEMYLTLNPILLLRYILPWTLSCCWDISHLEPYLVEMYLTLNPILLLRHVLKSTFISDTGTLSCGRLGPEQQEVTVLRSSSTTYRIKEACYWNTIPIFFIKRVINPYNEMLSF